MQTTFIPDAESRESANQASGQPGVTRAATDPTHPKAAAAEAADKRSAGLNVYSRIFQNQNLS